MTNALPNDFLKELLELDELDCFQNLNERRRFSRDFYDYSPVLAKKLSDCCADIAVKPYSIKAVISVVSICSQYEIPITLRGAGTGNYGQCVPLKGGVVIIMSALNSIREFDSFTGQVTVEPGCLMGDLDKYLSDKGRQLRLLPSTWKTASIGGFVSGGSGGVGSIRWGFLRDPGHLHGLEVITIGDYPQQINLDASSSEALNHAYGTNGIITALTLSTAPLVQWHEITIDCASWTDAVHLLKRCSEVAVNLFLGSLLQKEIVENIPNWSGESTGQHRLLFLVDPDGIKTLKRLAIERGASFNHLGKEGNSNGLREMTWNHTTLHMRSIDSNWTYLQMLLPLNEIEAIKIISKKWKKNILWHLESVRQQGGQRIAALPLVRWQGETELKELIDDCKNVGAIVFNPHVVTVEDGGLGVVDADQVNAKKSFDPKGILNPGKLKGWL
ncbi:MULTISPECIES: FAD-binding oxidoreductase [Prochlorococcus]|uniref:FAD-binding oxidoreductase n=1 Tax=Prochlorococcus TaxID=1218 RepID=UPI000533873B|nr:MULTISPECIES: FAD-binding oxidoreductase [Prochlorococcus]KGG11981.1 FAD/FMN-containing dehydrogenase [Prochlorococcus sp. MIT 0601]